MVLCFPHLDSSDDPPPYSPFRLVSLYFLPTDDVTTRQPLPSGLPKESPLQKRLDQRIVLVDYVDSFLCLRVRLAVSTFTQSPPGPQT